MMFCGLFIISDGILLSGEATAVLPVPLLDGVGPPPTKNDLLSGEATAGLPVPLLDGVDPFLPNNRAFSWASASCAFMPPDPVNT